MPASQSLNCFSYHYNIAENITTSTYIWKKFCLAIISLQEFNQGSWFNWICLIINKITTNLVSVQSGNVSSMSCSYLVFLLFWFLQIYNLGCNPDVKEGKDYFLYNFLLFGNIIILTVMLFIRRILIVSDQKRQVYRDMEGYVETRSCEWQALASRWVCKCSSR